MKLKAEDQTALSTLTEQLTFADGKYEAPILRKSGCPTLKNNREVALKRSEALEKKLPLIPQVLAKYMRNLRDYETKNYTSCVPKEKINDEN